MHRYYIKWYQDPENKKKVQVANRRMHILKKFKKLDLLSSDEELKNE